MKPHEPDLAALSAFHDGELGARERAGVERHLAGCAACRASLDAIASLSQALRALPEPAFGVDLAGVVDARLASAGGTPRARGTRFVPPITLGIGAAAALALGVSLGSALMTSGAATLAPMPALRVFDTIPPGGLCIGPASCYVNGGLR